MRAAYLCQALELYQWKDTARAKYPWERLSASTPHMAFCLLKSVYEWTQANTAFLIVNSNHTTPLILAKSPMTRWPLLFGVVLFIMSLNLNSSSISSFFVSWSTKKKSLSCNLSNFSTALARSMCQQPVVCGILILCRVLRNLRLIMTYKAEVSIRRQKWACRTIKLTTQLPVLSETG